MHKNYHEDPGTRVFANICFCCRFLHAGRCNSDVHAAPMPDPQIADCSKATDADIVMAVIKNINKRFKSEQIKAWLHLNITCKDGIVAISGDAHGINRKDPRGVRTTVTTIAQKTSCVKKVVTKHFTQDHPIKCDKTQKQCNGGCIDQKEECTPLIR